MKKPLLVRFEGPRGRSATHLARSLDPSSMLCGRYANRANRPLYLARFDDPVLDKAAQEEPGTMTGCSRCARAYLREIGELP